jgi:hypothetical protein
MGALHPLTFVFILIIMFCIGSWCGFAFGFRMGVRWCNVHLQGISDEMKKVADQARGRSST